MWHGEDGGLTQFALLEMQNIMITMEVLLLISFLKEIKLWEYNAIK